MAKAEQRSSSRSKIQPFEPSVLTLEAWNISLLASHPLNWSKFQNLSLMPNLHRTTPTSGTIDFSRRLPETCFVGGEEI
jgi:hypothetical protein